MEAIFIVEFLFESCQISTKCEWFVTCFHVVVDSKIFQKLSLQPCLFHLDQALHSYLLAIRDFCADLKRLKILRIDLVNTSDVSEFQNTQYRLLEDACEVRAATLNKIKSVISSRAEKYISKGTSELPGWTPKITYGPKPATSLTSTSMTHASNPNNGKTSHSLNDSSFMSSSVNKNVMHSVSFVGKDVDFQDSLMDNSSVYSCLGLSTNSMTSNSVNKFRVSANKSRSQAQGGMSYSERSLIRVIFHYSLENLHFLILPASVALIFLFSDKLPPHCSRDEIN